MASDEEYGRDGHDNYNETLVVPERLRGRGYAVVGCLEEDREQLEEAEYRQFDYAQNQPPSAFFAKMFYKKRVHTGNIATSWQNLATSWQNSSDFAIFVGTGSIGGSLEAVEQRVW